MKSVFRSLILCYLLFAACSNPLQKPISTTDSEPLADGMGRVTVYINGTGNERTAMPEGPLGIVEYEVAFIQQGQTQAAWRNTITSHSVTTDLFVGIYNVSVNGLNSNGQTVAFGTGEVNVSTRELNSVQIHLRNAGQEAGTGTLRFVMDIDDTVFVKPTEIFIYTLPGGSLETYRQLNDNEMQFYIPAGNYRVIISSLILKDGLLQSAARTLIAHVYVGNITTVLLELNENSGRIGLEYTVSTAAEFSAALNAIRTGSQRNVIITITGSFSIAPVSLTDTGFNNKEISIRSADPDSIHTITLSGNGSLLTVGSGQSSPSVALSDVIIAGHNANNAPLVRVAGGLLIINSGAQISGNRNHSTTAGQPVSGGGLIVEDGAVLKMYGGVIRDNTVSSTDGFARLTGGALVVSGIFEMYSGLIEENNITPVPTNVTSNGVFLGSGVMIENSGHFILHEGIIRNNTMSAGNRTGTQTFGGIGIYVDGIFEMHGGSITDHSGSGGNLSQLIRGGGILISSNGRAVMNGGVIAHNNLQNGSGAGVFIFNLGIFSLNDGEIHTNIITGTSATVTTNMGGGIFLDSNATLNMTGGKIYDNKAIQGGGIYSRNGRFELDGTEIYGNSANRGGGIYSWGTSARVTIENGRIEDNFWHDTAWSGFTDAYGAGIYINDGSLIINDGSISGNFIHFDYINLNNSLNAYGGGIAVTGGSFTLNGGRIAGNYVRTTHTDNYQSRAQGGGIFFNSSGTLIMRGGVISGSLAEQGGGIYLSDNLGGFDKSPLTGSITSGIIYGSEAVGNDDFGIELRNIATTGAAIRMISPSRVRNTTVNETTSLSHDSAENWAD